MKQTLVKVVFGAVAVFVIAGGSVRAEESFFSRLNPFRAFQRQTAQDAPAAVAPRSYGTPGPAWNSGQQGGGDQVGQPRFNGDAAGHGGRFGAGGESAMSEPTRASFEQRKHETADTEGRPARSGDSQGSGPRSMRSGPTSGLSEGLENHRSFGSFQEARAGSNSSRAGGAPGSFGRAGGGFGMASGRGFPGR